MYEDVREFKKAVRRMQVVNGKIHGRKKGKKDKLEFRYYEVEKDFPVLALLGERWEIPYGTDPMHFHNYLEIGYCYYGTGNMVGIGMESLYRAGTVTVIPKNYPHRTTGNGDEIQRWEYLFIDADQFLENMFGENQRQVTRSRQRLQTCYRILNEENEPEIGMLVKICLNEMRDKKEFYKKSATAALEALMICILRLFEGDDMLPMSDGFSGKNFDALQRTLNYIDEHYEENIGIGELVKISNLSETHYRRLFKECMHSSPKEYINLVRVDRACRMLASTDDQVENIALYTGFQTVGSLIRNFKKLVGVTPGEWRKRVQGNESHIANYKISILKGW